MYKLICFSFGSGHEGRTVWIDLETILPSLKHSNYSQLPKINKATMKKSFVSISWEVENLMQYAINTCYSWRQKSWKLNFFLFIFSAIKEFAERQKWLWMLPLIYWTIHQHKPHWGNTAGSTSAFEFTMTSNLTLVIHGNIQMLMETHNSILLNLADLLLIHED